MADAVIAALPNAHALVSAESVGEGHPDKVCDKVAEAVVDALLAEDPTARVSLQVLQKGDFLFLLGCVSSTCQPPYEQLVRRTVKKLSSDSKSLLPDISRVIVSIDQQSPEATNKAAEDGYGVSEAAVVTGYASNETAEGMPFVQVMASRLIQRLSDLARSSCRWVRADSHIQLTVEYKRTRGKLTPARVHTIVVSADSDTPCEDVKAQLREEVVKAVVPEQYLDDRTVYAVTPAGRSAGMSGRRGSSSYGCCTEAAFPSFTGKDPSKIEKFGAFASRWVAKSLVKAGLCDRVQVQFAYSSMQPTPLSLTIDSFGTSKGGRDDKDLATVVLRNFDLRADSLIQELNLRRSFYEKLVAAGPFGKEDDEDCAWERPKEISNL